MRGEIEDAIDKGRDSVMNYRFPGRIQDSTIQLGRDRGHGLGQPWVPQVAGVRTSAHPEIAVRVCNVGSKTLAKRSKFPSQVRPKEPAYATQHGQIADSGSNHVSRPASRGVAGVCTPAFVERA